MGRLSCCPMGAEQKGPRYALRKFPYSAYGRQFPEFLMLTADSMKIGHLVFLENVNENHKQNLILVPDKVEHLSPLNSLPASQLELVLGVLRLLKKLGFSLGLVTVLPDGTW